MCGLWVQLEIVGEDDGMDSEGAESKEGAGHGGELRDPFDLNINGVGDQQAPSLRCMCRRGTSS